MDTGPRKRRFFASDPDESQTRASSIEDNDVKPAEACSEGELGTIVERHGSEPIEALMSVLGPGVLRSTASRLLHEANDNLDHATNLFFDIATGHCSGERETKGIRTVELVPKKFHWKKRYLGCFGVDAWASRSSHGLIAAGNVVSIIRQSVSNEKSKSRSKGKFANLSLVRFACNGEEIGRLPQEVANMIAVLIDSEAAVFEAKCIYAPRKIRSGENILLQIYCYLTRKAFAPKCTGLNDFNRDRRMAFTKYSETDEERALRLRKLAILQLFDAVKQSPVESSISPQNRQSLILMTSSHKLLNGNLKRDNRDMKAATDVHEDEVANDQLDMLYSKAQLSDLHLAITEPPSTFGFELRTYQKQALTWMLSKESQSIDARAIQSMDPLWEKYKWVTENATGLTTNFEPEEKYFYMSPFTGEMSLKCPLTASECKGGILADEMGLGKTIEILSLIHTSFVQYTTEKRGPTLIICPMSILSQWQNEIETAWKDNEMRYLTYYGPEKANKISQLCSTSMPPDIILTTYGVVMSEYTQLNAEKDHADDNSGLFAINFGRVVLDEGHNIRNRMSKTFRACRALKAPVRWVVTGTPIVNRLEDLFSLVKFLDVLPWADYNYWRTFITIPFESKNYIQALNVVQSVLEPLVLRRIKDMKDAQGQPIANLPEKTIVKEYIDLSPEEKKIYTYIFDRARRAYRENVAAGTVFKSYTTILSMLLRLRQACCDISLVKKLKDEKELKHSDVFDDINLNSLIKGADDSNCERDVGKTYGAQVLKQILNQEETECAICTAEPIVNGAITMPCFHISCEQCILQHIQYSRSRGEIPLCHTCRVPISEDSVYEVVRKPGDEGTTARVVLRRKGVQYSSKLKALLQHLHTLRETEPRSKIVVFSQFTSFLDIIAKAFTQNQFQYVRLDGTMDQGSRAQALAKFQNYPKHLVMLISLKAGGVGLNLVAASRVFMLDPWWSYAVELQAIDRIHRLGQTQPVKVVRFIMRGTIEEKMLKIQDRKNFVASSLGMSKDDEQHRTLDDIQVLFEEN